MYNTDINIIASIPDFNLITDVIGDYAQGKSEDDVYDKIFTQNIYGIRTGKSRDRFLHAIKAVFLKFKTEDHKAVFYTLFKTPGFLQAKKMALFYQFAINNDLFFDISTTVFLKLYKAGRLTADKAEFVSYLYALRDDHTEIRKWSDSTIEMIASKYLTFLKKTGFLKGRAKKEFCNITPDDFTLVYLIYLIKSLGESNSDILKNSFTPLLMLDQANLADRLKKISLVDYITVSTLGYDLNVDLKYRYEEIVDVISEKYQPEI